MNFLMLLLRLIHILAGVFWVGATLTTSYYLKPTKDISARTRLATAMTASGILNVLAGYAMYWLDSDGFSSAWMHSGPGIGFAIGGAFGLLGLILRILANRNMKKMNKLAAGSSERSQNLLALEKKLARLDIFNVWALIIAVLFMATARYLVF
jgi:uncharacterized membrane protein